MVEARELCGTREAREGLAYVEYRKAFPISYRDTEDIEHLGFYLSFESNRTTTYVLLTNLKREERTYIFIKHFFSPIWPPINMSEQEKNIYLSCLTAVLWLLKHVTVAAG